MFETLTSKLKVYSTTRTSIAGIQIKNCQAQMIKTKIDKSKNIRSAINPL